MTDLEQLTAHRPKRADARRNYDALVHAAREAFAEHGTTAPLEDIARRANVGIGTLYRNFPTREDLVESVYVDEVLDVCAAAQDVSHLEPWAALTAWIHRLTRYIATKRVLIDGLNRDSDTFKACRTALYPAGQVLVERAQAAGVVRADVSIGDVLRLVTGLAGVSFEHDAQRDHLLNIALDGLRPQPDR